MRKAISRLIPERNSTSAWWQTSASQGRTAGHHKLDRRTAPAQRIGIGLVGRALRGKGLSFECGKKWRKKVGSVWWPLHPRINAGSLPAMEIALFQPDQPQNTGTMLRLAACMGVPAHVIEPCGFPFSHKAFRRSAMDYADLVDLRHHLDWAAFEDARRQAGKRLILLTTKAPEPYTGFRFMAGDILLVGSESSGAPEHVHESANARVTIPMAQGARSLNVALSLAMVLGEAIRQTADATEGNGQ